MVFQSPPKAILFDIGGVCVLSPFSAIQKYEHENNIPPNWINFAISRYPTNGHFQRLERGEIKLDDAFFKGFRDDLSDENSWREFHAQYSDKNRSKSQRRRLKDVAAATNPSQLGDPISLKAETADSRPTDEDRGAASAVFNQDSHTGSQSPETEIRSNDEEKYKPKLSKLAQDTTIGDPTSLEAEAVVVSSPQNGERQPAAAAAAAAVSQSAATTSNAPNSGDSSQYTPTKSSSPSPSQSGHHLPPIPPIDVSTLFWSMMSHARHPDPYIFPALQRLASLSPHQKPILAALSNTVTFPPSHPFSSPSTSSSSSSSSSSHSSSPSSSSPSPIPSFLHPYFDIIIASSEIGMRKPEPRIYKLAIQRLDAYDREQRGGKGIKASDVLFLDDIGENLRAAKEMGGGGRQERGGGGGGMRTLKVVRDKTWRAVKEIEKALGGGVELMDEKTRRAKL